MFNRPMIFFSFMMMILSFDLYHVSNGAKMLAHDSCDLELKIVHKRKKIIYSYVDFIEIQVSFLTYIFLFSKKDMKPISAER